MFRPIKNGWAIFVSMLLIGLVGMMGGFRPKPTAAQPDLSGQPLTIHLTEYGDAGSGVTDISNSGISSDSRLFITRQRGLIVVLDGGGNSIGTFLDIQNRVLDSGAMGLLSLAFDPNYATNGYFYIHYVSPDNDHTTRISRWRATANPTYAQSNTADPNSEVILGMGIVGVGAGELIAEGALAIEMGCTITDLKMTVHAHPTLSETLMESAEVYHGQSAHYIPRK